MLARSGARSSILWESSTKARTAHQQGTTKATTAHQQGTTKARTAHQQGTTKARTAHQQGTTKARTAHQRRTTKARTRTYGLLWLWLVSIGTISMQDDWSREARIQSLGLKHLITRENTKKRTSTQMEQKAI